MTRSWLSAVVFSRSSASVAHATAESKPKVMTVAWRSLSIVLGTATMGQLASKNCWAMVSVPSPPAAMIPTSPRASADFIAFCTSSSGSRPA